MVAFLFLWKRSKTQTRSPRPEQGMQTPLFLGRASISVKEKEYEARLAALRFHLRYLGVAELRS